jgi:hypothetical protein
LDEMGVAPPPPPNSDPFRTMGVQARVEEFLVKRRIAELNVMLSKYDLGRTYHHSTDDAHELYALNAEHK